ncbi:MAG: aldo/keto reductase [Planctomycetes bacterium]|nr:aldo/keto reductase [Planctomycetota bacterium]
MVYRSLGHTGLSVSPIGFGAFKIGRNVGTKYEQNYDLPSDKEVERLLNGLLDLGINYIDTAPAYGTSEVRIGKAITHRRDDYVLSTKVGETFVDGKSTYDFSVQAIRDSVHRSLKNLQTDVLDVVLIHSNGEDLEILNQTDAVATLVDLRNDGLIRAIGFSGKTVEGAQASLVWVDVLMVQYNQQDQTHKQLIADAAGKGIGVVIKKGLASGVIEPAQAIPFALKTQGVNSMVVGSLNLKHLQANLQLANYL